MRLLLTCLSLFVFSLIFANCTYTKLQTQSSDNIKSKRYPSGPLPDLAITCVTFSESEILVADDPSAPVTFLNVHIKNVGVASFTGALMISFADDPQEIAWKRFSRFGGLGNYTLQPKDSTILTSRHDRYLGRTLFRFVLRTDGYPLHTFDPVGYFGREPIPETSYENNEIDFIIP